MRWEILRSTASLWARGANPPALNCPRRGFCRGLGRRVLTTQTLSSPPHVVFVASFAASLKTSEAVKKKKRMGHTRCTDRRGVLPSRQNQFFIRECVSLCSRGLRGPRHTRRWPLRLLAVGKQKLGPEPLRRSGSRRPASDRKRLGFFFLKCFMAHACRSPGGPPSSCTHGNKHTLVYIVQLVYIVRRLRVFFFIHLPLPHHDFS